MKPLKSQCNEQVILYLTFTLFSLFEKKKMNENGFCISFQGLKSHAVTMFEVGKLSDESLDSFLGELEKVCVASNHIFSCFPVCVVVEASYHNLHLLKHSIIEVFLLQTP